jgi:predicted Rossmann-fold nucleotide-binding protein
MHNAPEITGNASDFSVMLQRLPIVAVLGDGSTVPPARAVLAVQIGAMVAGLGAHLLTGAGFGVMAAAAEGFVGKSGRRGLSIGIVPRDPAGAMDAPNRSDTGALYPNPYIEIAIFTPLPPRVEDWTRTPSRNHINILTANAIVALPGRNGTRNELEMALTYRGETAKPRDERRTVLVGPAEEFPPDLRESFARVTSTAEAEQYLVKVLAAAGFVV